MDDAESKRCSVVLCPLCSSGLVAFAAGGLLAMEWTLFDGAARRRLPAGGTVSASSDVVDVRAVALIGFTLKPSPSVGRVFS